MTSLLEVVDLETAYGASQVLFGVKLRPFFERGTRLRTRGLDGAKAILTADQWMRVPARIKTPQGFGGPGGGGGGGGRPPNE